MKNIIALSLGVGLLLGSSVALAIDPETRLTQPRGSSKDRSGSDQATQSDSPGGRVLVLENERTLTGEIERVGDQYRIKRLIGETWIPASKVLTVCATLQEAYLFLQRRANLNDPDERIRLSEWCRQHGLRAQALTEGKAALALKPDDERLRRLVRFLEESPAPVQVAAPAAPTETPVPRVEVTGESLRLFATRVQPILMNACASCHVAGRGGSFQLTRVYGPGLANRKSLEKNLSAVMNQVNMNDPRASKLLIKSLSLHGPGMTREPFRNRQAPAYQSIEDWVVKTVESNPHLREQASVVPAVATSPPEAGWGADRTPKPPEPPVVPASTAQTPAPKPAQPPPAPKSKKESLDPVDPDSFNREFHPMRKPKGDPS